MKKSTIFALIATLSMFILLMLFIAFVRLSVQFDELNEIVIQQPSLEEVSDGTYIGTYEVFPLSVHIHVTISNHQYESITVEHHSLFFDEQSEVIIEDIIQTQEFDFEFEEENAYSEKIMLLAIVDAIDTMEEVHEDASS